MTPGRREEPGLTRLTRWTRPLVSAPPLRLGWQVVAIAASTLLLALLGWADATSGSGLNLAVLYVIPALVAAVLAGLLPALTASVEGSVAWAVAEPAVHGSLALHTMDAGIRFLAVAGASVMIESLRRATTAAAQSDRRARDMLGMVAHQMRTPVAALRASAETLVAMGASPDQEPFLADIAAEAGRVGRLLNNILWLSRIDAGAGYPLRVARPLEACRQEAERVERRRPDLVVEVTGSSETLELAAHVLRESVANLLDNAGRFARSRIRVQVHRRQDLIMVEVDDDGPGVPAGQEEAVFDRFVSLDGGTGLGLALSRGAARAAGGDLSLRQGRFRLVLPARPLPDNPPGPPVIDLMVDRERAVEPAT